MRKSIFQLLQVSLNYGKIALKYLRIDASLNHYYNAYI